MSVTRTAEWVHAAWKASRDYPPALAHTALAVLELCSADEIARSILRRGAALDFASAELSTALVSSAVVLRNGNAAQRTEAARYIDVLLQLLPQLVEDPKAAMALAALGGTAIARPRDIAIDRQVLRGGDDAAVATAFEQIEAATLMGTHPVESPGVVADLVEGVAVYAMRRYELPLAMRALRAAAYLRPRSSLARDAALRFLRLAQCDDGSFGDYDAAILAAARQRPDSHALLAIKLPVTFQALWTIAEAEAPSFRLFRRIASVIRGAHADA